MKGTAQISIMAVLVLLLTACAKEPAESITTDTGSSYGPDPDHVREYTVMFYGCGGGTLDDYLVNDLKECFSVGSDDTVSMSCLIKMSKAYHGDKFNGTARFIVPRATQLQSISQIRYEQIGDHTFPLYDPDNLSDFIKWNVQNLPARNYILILWNHGGGWNPQDDRPTRAILFDDNVLDRAMKHDELIEALEKSDVHLKAIMTDACMMGLLETYTDYARYADYALGAVEISPNIGLRYDWLLQSLKKSDFEAAMREFTDELCHYWEVNCPLDPQREATEEMTDFGYVKLLYMDSLNAAFGRAVDNYSDSLRMRLRAIPFYDSRYQFSDAGTIVRCLHGGDDFVNTLKACSYRYVLHPSYEKPPLRDITIGVCLPTGSFYRSVYKGAYDSLTFVRQTGWNKILEQL